jgi:hypothetical protein
MGSEQGLTDDENPGAWDASHPGHAELVQMRIRVIALENLVLALLAQSDAGVRQQVRERADEIPPRDDASEHPLTEHARTEMLKLLARAERRSS